MSFAKLQSHIAKVMQEKDLPGLAVCAVKDGRIVYEEGFGQADIDRKTNVNENTLWQIFSVTKTLTASAVLKLVEMGHVRLDEDIRTYFPEFTFRPRRGAQEQPISLADVLSHRSGYNRSMASLTVHFPGEQGPDFDTLAKKLLDRRMVAKPGAWPHYANVNYYLLAGLIERVSGCDFDTFIAREFLKPLGMNQTYTTVSEEIFDQLAVGYVPGFSMGSVMLRLLVPYRQYRHLVSRSKAGFKRLAHFEMDGKGYGGLVSTVSDLARFAAFQLQDEKQYAEILSFNHRKLMRQTHGYFGYSWLFDKTAGERVAWHTGGGPGFKTYLGIVPDRNLGIVVAMNNFTFSGVEKDIASRLIRMDQNRTFSKMGTAPTPELCEVL